MLRNLISRMRHAARSPLAIGASFLAFALTLALPLSLTGCGDNNESADGTWESPYVEPTSPDNVLTDLRVAYERRDADHYRALLVDDFTFILDPDSQDWAGIQKWGSAEEAQRTTRLFEGDAVPRIALEIFWTAGSAAPDAVHPAWEHVAVDEDHLEADFVPADQDTLTYRVQNQVQQFYFRRGRTSSDTMPTSQTAGRWYLVEWRDEGTLSALEGCVPPITSTSWSRVKMLVE